jgi:phage terminase large subunit-like protein
VPAGIVSTGWPAVEAKCREFGDTFDEWQRGAGRVILGKRADGIYAATVGGITLSIPRQVAKTFLIGRIIFALCVLFPGLKVLWTAHRTRTSTMTFRSLQAFARRKSVQPYLASGRNDGIRTANGEQEISFRNGSIIMFGAREAGFGRGFDEVDIEVFDEAQILTEKALEDMVAATNQSRHVHGALLFYMGTPPRPVDPGEAFSAKRADALAGTSEDSVYIECSADPDADPDDREQWRIANPSYPHRTPLRSMLRLRKNLPSEDSWKREALGIWDEESAGKGIDFARWLTLIDTNPTLTAPTFAIATAPDRSWSAICAAWRRPDGAVQLLLGEDYRADATWVAARAAELRSRYGGQVIAANKAARGLVPDAVELSEQEQAKAHNLLADAVLAGTLRHGNEPAMNTAVRAARWKSSGDTRVLDQKGSTDISPLTAAAGAMHGLLTSTDTGGMVMFL